MITVGNSYQNVGVNSGFSQTNFSANPSVALKRGESVFNHSPKKAVNASDAIGYGLFTLLIASVCAKNEKAVELFKKFTNKKYINETMEKLKAQNSNLVSLYHNVKSKVLEKSKAVCAYKMNHNISLKSKDD